MTWLESFSYCSLASEDSKPYLADGEYRGWAGGFYSNSQWMVHEVPKQMDFKRNYQSAYRKCSSLNGTILSTIHNLDNLVDGGEYWSNIFRSMFLKWTTNESFDEICSEVNGLLNLDCLYLEVKYRHVKYIPLPCERKYRAICKPKQQPGNQAVIRKCQTEMSTTASKKEEISTRERSTSSIKEKISAEESKMTSMTILNSVHESTDVTVFSTSTTTNKSSIFVASSTPIMFTTNISTNISDTKFVKRSSTKELHFSVTTTFSIAVPVFLAVFVLVCLLVSL
ncbi:Hypothetical predicted protein [Mytilus galloprovincialis]|uniref:C-type lectin domain-containing protein n=1 Tax=Mytilus galloprovincialis TaxID=29158 RepID=A0A8B6G4V5_MYTGA|nr:Hypothetical predicted protein [Mytilus galloprovincialis]